MVAGLECSGWSIGGCQVVARASCVEVARVF